MTPIANIGLDIVSVARFENHTAPDDPLLLRLFTAAELETLPLGSKRAERLAGRWAAKEAVAKALGCGFGERLGFRDVEIVRNEKGAPLVRLSDTAAARHHHPRIVVSITHDGDYAAAAAIRIEA